MKKDNFRFNAMKRSEILIFCCVSFIIGIGFGLAYDFEILLVYIFFFSALVFLTVFWKNINLRILFFGILFLFSGMMMCGVQAFLYPTVSNEVFGEKIKMQGIILDEPENSYDRQRFAFDVGKMNIGDWRVDYKLRILVNANLYPKYNYGDRLEIECKLQEPEPFGNFRYDKYLELDRINALCYYPKILILEKNHGNKIYARILTLKRRFNETIQHYVDEPQSSVMSAILLGNKYGISDELKEIFSRAGISHILAVSGMHIGILGVILLYVLNFIGVSRKKAFYFISAIVVLYVIMIGAPASAIRAAVMGFILMLALQFGRLSKLLNVLFLAACLMLLIKPGLLFYDIGFQLSFMAIFGIYFLYPVIKNLFSRLCEVSFPLLNKEGLPVRRIGGGVVSAAIEIISISLAAEIFILPLSIYYFSVFSVIAPFANLAVVWLVPIIMFLGLALIFAGYIIFYIPILGFILKIIGVLISFLLGYFVASTQILVSFSWSSFEIQNFPLFSVVLCYAIIAGAVLSLSFTRRGQGW